MRYMRVDKDEELGFVAQLVTEEWSEDGDVDVSVETLYPGTDLGMAISFAVDNAKNLYLPLHFTSKVVQEWKG